MLAGVDYSRPLAQASRSLGSFPHAARLMDCPRHAGNHKPVRQVLQPSLQLQPSRLFGRPARPQEGKLPPLLYSEKGVQPQSC